MWSWAKHLYVAIRLAALWENLKAVRAGDPTTTSESYRAAAAAILGDPGVQRWMARLSPVEHARFTEGLPVFIWGLDSMTE